MRPVALAVLLPILLSCTAGFRRPSPGVTESRQELISRPAPESWNPGSIWVFVLLDAHGEIVRSLTFRITDRPADSCLAGDWRVLETLAERPPRDPMFQGKPAYEISGSAIQIDLAANLCDNSYPLRGKLSERGVGGEHGTETMWGGETIGTFYGAPVVQ